MELDSTLYARRRKDLITLVNELRAAGAQDDLDLPGITVIGNQSAGKSSVVESISGITVPRDSGTCTRCPMECRLTNSPSSFTCRISIRREFVPNSNKRLAEPVEMPFGDIITDKADVEPALRRAQLCALNPSLPFSRAVDATDEDLKIMMDKTVTKVAFTRDVVCIDLRGPELTDLAFIDLPGLIQNAEPHVVQLVEEIVVSHIRGRCLILVALPMTDDIENQKALRLARQEDPQGLRTIGVLTKPDMLTAGNIKSLQNWIQVLEGGGRHPLAHGYYCTRQLNDDERLKAVTTSRSREIEATFFKQTAPWNRSSAADRFGMPNLIDNLGRLLISYIQDTLPIVNEAANDLMASCRFELAKLPASLFAIDGGEEAGTCMLRLITELSQDVRECVRGVNAFDLGLSRGMDAPSQTKGAKDGTSKTARMIQAHRGLYRNLKTAIRLTAPNFVPWEDKQSSKMTNAKFVNSLEDGEEDELDTTKGLGDGERYTLTKMRKHIDSSVTRELPNNIPFSAKAALITAFQSTWPDAVYTCLNEVKRITLEVLIERVDEHFGQYNFLKRTIISHIIELIQKHYDICLFLLQTELEKELSPFTQNTQYLETCTEKWLAKYKGARNGGSKPSSKGFATAATALNPAFSSATPPTQQAAEGGPLPSAPEPAFSFATPPTQQAAEGKPLASAPKLAFPSADPPAQQAANGNLFNLPARRIVVRAPKSFDTTTSGTNPPSPPTNGFGSPSPFEKLGSNQSSSPFAAFIPPPPSTGLFVNSAESRQSFGESPFPASARPAGSSPLGGVSTQAADIRQAVAALAKIGYTVASEDLAKLAPLDEFENEMKVMAEVRGYFEVAYKRMIDNIPNDIDLRFVKAVAKDLQGFLIAKFELGTASANEICVEYLVEDAFVAGRRKDLLAKQKRLLTVLQKLQKFGVWAY